MGRVYRSRDWAPITRLILIEGGTIISCTDGNLIPPKFSYGNIEHVLLNKGPTSAL